MHSDRKVELTALLEISKVLTSSFELKDNLNKSMEILAHSLDMRRGCVFLFDNNTGMLEIIAAHGLTEGEIRKGKYKIGEGIVGKVIEQGVPMFIPDIGEEPRFLNKTGSRINRKGISFLCVPIKIGEDVMGVISVDRIYSEERGEVDDDLRVLEIISGLIGQFLKLWLNYKKIESEKEILNNQLREKFNLPNIIGVSPNIMAVVKNAIKVAQTDATVLLLGETGTGKELIAKTIHFQSRRSNFPFVAINCAAIPENLLEVELFGSEKGAFTDAIKRIGKFELADKGTIFLDEIGELPLKLQPKLLRVLQEKVFEPIGSNKPRKTDVRIISATNRNLYEEVKKGNFREDLFWRLNVISIQIPPLRERKEDIPLLTDFFLDKYSKIYNKKIKLDDKIMEVLIKYPFPGNVRELENLIERLVIMCENHLIKVEDLPLYIRSSDHKYGSYNNKDNLDKTKTGLMDEIEELERNRILNALEKNGYVLKRTAKYLGITERQLGYRLKKFGINLKDFQDF